jgi:tripartite-type tricarboxylate transporter receptor subunit TctC
MTTFLQITRRGFQRVAVACATMVAIGGAMAQNFPDKPIRIVVGWPAGGTADMIARLVGEGLVPLLGQPVIVDNKPGAAGTLGLHELLKSPRDGHTLMVGVSGMASEVPHIMKMSVDPLKELRPLVELARSGLLLVGTPQLPAQDLKGVLAYVKANPGKVSYASYGMGTMSHTLGMQLNKHEGVDMVHVAYRGSPPGLADVMSGSVPLMFDGPATSIPLIKGGKIRAIATTGPTRIAALPDVPTFAELGYKDMTEVLWMGLWTTPDVPEATQAKIRQAVLKVLQQPKVREQLVSFGMEPGAGTTPEEMGRSLRIASERQAAMLKSIGFKPE